MSHMIRLQPADGEIVETDVKVANTSGTIKNLLEDLAIEECTDTVIQLPNVGAAVLRKVLEWANHHKDDPTPRDDNGNIAENVSAWDAEFLKTNQGSLVELVAAADYLDIKLLFHIACKTIMITGEGTEDIRKFFNSENDNVWRECEVD